MHQHRILQTILPTIEPILKQATPTIRKNSTAVSNLRLSRNFGSFQQDQLKKFNKNFSIQAGIFI